MSSLTRASSAADRFTASAPAGTPLRRQPATISMTIAQRHHHAAHNRDCGERDQYEPVEAAASGMLLLQQAFRFVQKIALAVESDILSRHGSHLAAPA